MKKTCRVREKRKYNRFQHIIASPVRVSVNVQISADAGEAARRYSSVRCGQNVDVADRAAIGDASS